MDEPVQVTIHDLLDIRGIHTGSQVFHHLVWLEHILTDLVAPSNLTLFAIEFFHLSPFFILVLFV